jgi:DNA-binding IclR family transcriptional regulator
MSCNTVRLTDVCVNMNYFASYCDTYYTSAMDQGIQVIGRAAAILRFCKTAPGGVSLGAIAAVVELPRSTVQRIVQALVAEGLLSSSGAAASIRLGAGLYDLAEHQGMGVLEIAHPHLKALSEETGETVDLAVFRRDHLVFIDQIAGSQRLRAISAVGDQFPLHNTANGRACVALMTDAELTQCAAVLRPLGKQKLARLIKSARQAGFAVDEDEHAIGISALGTAFRDLTGSLYGISIPMPSVRFHARQNTFKALLLTTKANILAALSAN